MSKISEFFIVVASLTYLHDRRKAQKSAREEQKRRHPVKAKPQEQPPAVFMLPVLGVMLLLFAGVFAIFTDSFYLVFLFSAAIIFFAWGILLLMRCVNRRPSE